MRFVVTGAAGFIGSHLAEALGEAGHEVVGLDSFTDYYDPALKEENARELDVRRLDLAEDELDFRGYDGVFHLAGQPGVRKSFTDFASYLSRNVLASQRVFDAAARAEIRVVFASSSTTYGDAGRYPTPEDVPAHPISPYGITKLACENLASAYAKSVGLDVVTLRYFTVYGPRQRPDMAFTRIVNALAEGRPFDLYGDGSVSRSFTFVAETSMRDAIALCERIAGRTLELRTAPVASGDVRRTAADTTRIREQLGWEPTVGLEQGLRAQWLWASARVAAR
jgi:UDP-glucuronate 4-epimerase